MPDTIIAQIKVRSDTAENWEKVNPVLATGELGFDTTNNQLKIGNMGLSWNSLTAINAGFTYMMVSNPTNPNTVTNIIPSTNNQQDNNNETPSIAPTTNTTSTLIVYNDNIRRTASTYEPAYIRLYNLFIACNNITNNLNIYPYDIGVFDHVIIYSHLKISQNDPAYGAYTLSLLRNIVNDSIVIVGQDRTSQFTSLFINNALVWDTNVNSVILSLSGPDIIDRYKRMLYYVQKYKNDEIAQFLTVPTGEYQPACIKKVINIFENEIINDINSPFALSFETVEKTQLIIQLIKQNATNIAMSFGY